MGEAHGFPGAEGARTTDGVPGAHEELEAQGRCCPAAFVFREPCSPLQMCGVDMKQSE